EAVQAAGQQLAGPILQVPSSVSAVKVAGVRSYSRVRAGEEVRLERRAVTVRVFDVLAQRRPTPDLVDLDVHVECSSGTYVRALARDLGAALGVGGHLTALRRTRSGRFDLPTARTLKELRSEEHTSELQSQSNLVCRLLLEKKKQELRLVIRSGTTAHSYVRGLR